MSVGASRARTIRANFEYYQPVSGFAFNAFFQRNAKHFFVKTALGASQKGHVQSLIYIDANNNVLGEGAIEKTRHLYTHLSGLAGVEFGNTLYGSVGLGATAFGYLGTVVSGDAFELNNGQTIDAYRVGKDYLKAFDFALTSEAAVGYRFPNNFALFLLSSYDFGLLSIRYKTGETLNPWKNRSLTFQVGMRFSISEPSSEECLD